MAKKKFVNPTTISKEEKAFVEGSAHANSPTPFTPEKPSTKPKAEKAERFTLSFKPSFMEEIDTFLAEFPEAGSSRSNLLYRAALIYMKRTRNE